MSPKNLENRLQAVFQKIMKHCQEERKTKTDITLRELAKSLGKTENFLSSVENGREFPSMQTFLTYLLILGFETEPLTKLSIPLDSATTKEMEPEKEELINKIYNLESKQVSFLLEQSRVAENFWQTKKSPKKKIS